MQAEVDGYLATLKYMIQFWAKFPHLLPKRTFLQQELESVFGETLELKSKLNPEPIIEEIQTMILERIHEDMQSMCANFQ